MMMVVMMMMMMMMVTMKIYSPTCIKAADIKLVKSRVIKDIDKHCRRTIERITPEKQPASPHLNGPSLSCCFVFLSVRSWSF